VLMYRWMHFLRQLYMPELDIYSHELSLNPCWHFPRFHVARLLPLYSPGITSHTARCTHVSFTFSNGLGKHLPLLNAGFSIGSCTISAFAAPNMTASA